MIPRISLMECMIYLTHKTSKDNIVMRNKKNQ